MWLLKAVVGFVKFMKEISFGTGNAYTRKKGSLHNVYFVQYDAPVSFMTLYPIGKKGWIQGHILGKITDLEFKITKM